ncbi:unnamed protein product [Symbiodinium sp. CCMP2456]|nr:unnamed protein product [Symbiodinium sp. CCMP2456]
MMLLPQYPSWWKCKHAAQVYDWERLLLSTIDAGEHVYTVYEKAGNRQYCSIDLHLLQAAARPVHNQSERAVNLVMTHRLRPGRDGLVFLLRFDRDYRPFKVPFNGSFKGSVYGGFP